jgi:hypothetical protein
MRSTIPTQSIACGRTRSLCCAIGVVVCLVARRGRGRPICDALCPRDVHKMRAEQRHDHVGVDQCVHLWCVHARVLFCGCKHIHLRCKANGHHRRPRARTANALCDRMLRHTHARLSKDTEQNGLLPNKTGFYRTKRAFTEQNGLLAPTLSGTSTTAACPCRRGNSVSTEPLQRTSAHRPERCSTCSVA